MINWQVPRAPNPKGIAPAYFVDKLRTTVIPNHEELLARCRAAGVAVVFLRIGCANSDYSDAVPALRGFYEEYGAVDGTPACEVISELVEDGDTTLLKTGSSGFVSSGLDTHLRNMGITHALYTGVITNACVMLTAAAGFDLGYYGYLVADATATFSAELQGQAESLISEFMAQIVTTEDVLGMLAEGPVAARPT